MTYARRYPPRCARSCARNVARTREQWNGTCLGNGPQARLGNARPHGGRAYEGTRSTARRQHAHTRVSPPCVSLSTCRVPRHVAVGTWNQAWYPRQRRGYRSVRTRRFTQHVHAHARVHVLLNAREHVPVERALGTFTRSRQRRRRMAVWWAVAAARRAAASSRYVAVVAARVPRARSSSPVCPRYPGTQLPSSRPGTRGAPPPSSGGQSPPHPRTVERAPVGNGPQATLGYIGYPGQSPGYGGPVAAGSGTLLVATTPLFAGSLLLVTFLPSQTSPVDYVGDEPWIPCQGSKVPYRLRHGVQVKRRLPVPPRRGEPELLISSIAGGRDPGIPPRGSQGP